jgi:hypothetical protein
MNVDAQILRICTQLDADRDRLAKCKHSQSFDFTGSFPAVALDNDGLFHTLNTAEMPMHRMFTEPTLFANTGITQQPETAWMGLDGKLFKRHRGPAKQPPFARAKNNPERQLA